MPIARRKQDRHGAAEQAEPGALAPPPELDRADAVFEGGGVKALAFAGALAAAEQAGIRSWVNVAGTSAGAFTAALLAVGYDAAGLRTILDRTDYEAFADYGRGGKWLGGVRNALRLRGVVPGRYLLTWLGHCFAESPVGKRNLTFGDLVRDDLPPGLTAEEEAKAKYRLRLVAADVTLGRMLVLPDDIDQYQKKSGESYVKDEFSVARAVRMSMSYPFFFDPVVLYQNGRPHLIVDGGLISNFPVWLFDSLAPSRRWTLGFRLHAGVGSMEPPYRRCPRPLWQLPLARALAQTAVEAWDLRMSETSRTRTVNIPTGSVRTLQLRLSERERSELYEAGYRAATEFFERQTTYRNSYGYRAAGPAAGTVELAEQPV